MIKAAKKCTSGEALANLILIYFNPAQSGKDERCEGFIGAILVFVGVTNNCGMGMALAKMPWYQKSKTEF